MAIAKRITLLYGGLFSATLLFLSAVLMLNISGLQQGEMRRQLQEAVSEIQSYLESGKVLSDKALEELLAEKYGFYYVDLFSPLFDVSTGEVYEGYTVDGGHFTDKGYEVVTAQIPPVLESILGK